MSDRSQGEEVYPEDLSYTEQHEWLREGNGDVVRIGITEFAVHELGDIVYVSMAQVGEELVTGDVAGQVDSPKATADIYAPVSGIVTAVNSQLDNSPELVNSDPYGDGWLIEIEMTDGEELEGLLDSDGYEALVEA